ncbi:MAG: nicotinate-nucleotide adenylyltransferase [Chitinophagales bacterium]|nr:nicotinate-nucleotide adenylyltransferase [Chitinophagales bacterium]
MKIGLFFGSFNPIHVGHLFIANHMAYNTALDEVWLMVSPQNPFKSKESLLPEYDRLHLVNLAIENNFKLRASNIEFSMPKPSYTIDTLVYLKEKYPNHHFSLIMGVDNLPTLHKWKNYEVLIENYDFYLFKRPGFEINEKDLTNRMHVEDIPQVFLSASYIRDAIKNNKSVRYLMPEAVEKYVSEMGWFKK